MPRLLVVPPSFPTSVWLPVVGFPGYEVSDDGRVLSMPRWVWCLASAQSAAGHRRLTGGIELKPSPASGGYPAVTLYRDGRRHTCAVHQLVAAAHIAPCPPGQEVRHWDGNKLNCRSLNLLYGTPARNAEDRNRHGTTAHGEQVGNAKLTNDLVREIRARRAAGAFLRELSTEYGIHVATVSRVARRENWAHVT